MLRSKSVVSLKQAFNHGSPWHSPSSQTIAQIHPRSPGPPSLPGSPVASAPGSPSIAGSPADLHGSPIAHGHFLPRRPDTPIPRLPSNLGLGLGLPSSVRRVSTARPSMPTVFQGVPTPTIINSSPRSLSTSASSQVAAAQSPSSAQELVKGSPLMSQTAKTALTSSKGGTASAPCTPVLLRLQRTKRQPRKLSVNFDANPTIIRTEIGLSEAMSTLTLAESGNGTASLKSRRSVKGRKPTPYVTKNSFISDAELETALQGRTSHTGTD